MKTYKIPVIAGDGIGPEVIAEGKKVLEAAGENYGFNIEWKEYPFGAEHYLSTGELITEDALKELSNYDAIFLGSVARACPIGGARARRPIRAEILSRSIHKPPPYPVAGGCRNASSRQRS